MTGGLRYLRNPVLNDIRNNSNLYFQETYP
jgi:hypothetical protein